MRDLTDEESKIYNDRLESEAIDTAIRILDNLRPSCGPKLTFTEEEIYTALSMGISAIKELEKAKGLLKAAVEDSSAEAESICAFCINNDLVNGCRYADVCEEDNHYVWRYADEALKLIGGENYV